MKTTETLQTFLAFAHPPGNLFEIRMLASSKTCPRTAAGLFDNAAAAAAEVTAAVQKWPEANFYYTLNPINPESAYAQSADRNRIKPNVSSTAKDADIWCRNLYLVDLDPCRPANTGSTAAERKAAKALTIEVRAHLTAQGWPEPSLVSSGNGFHLLYRAGRCSASTGAWKAALAALADRFNTPQIKIDTTVYNPARIARLPWTMNHKGQTTIERPHREAKLFKLGPSTSVSEDQVVALLRDAEPAVPLVQTSSSAKEYSDGPRRVCILDERGVDDLILRYPEHLGLLRKQRKGAAVLFHLTDCPFKGGSHQGQEGGKTSLLWSVGVLGFKCFSDDCSRHTVDSLVRLLEEKSGHSIKHQIWQNTTPAQATEEWSSSGDHARREYVPSSDAPIFRTREVPQIGMYV